MPKHDWRIDLVENLRGEKLQWKKYRRYSENWDHDHCGACGAKFAEIPGYKILNEGYATTDAYPMGAEYEWVCKTCFDDLHDELEWTAI